LKTDIDALLEVCHQQDVAVEGFNIQQQKRLSNYVKRRKKCARTILEKVYSMYPIKNAWAEVCFGNNINGIYGATLDDPMHYCDSGMFLYLSQVIFLSMTECERGEMEAIIKSYVGSK
jgi:hypothetical protein